MKNNIRSIALAVMASCTWCGAIAQDSLFIETVMKDIEAINQVIYRKYRVLSCYNDDYSVINELFFNYYGPVNKEIFKSGEFVDYLYPDYHSQKSKLHKGWAIIYSEKTGKYFGRWENLATNDGWASCNTGSKLQDNLIRLIIEEKAKALLYLYGTSSIINFMIDANDKLWVVDVLKGCKYEISDYMDEHWEDYSKGALYNNSKCIP